MLIPDSDMDRVEYMKQKVNIEEVYSKIKEKAQLKEERIRAAKMLQE